MQMFSSINKNVFLDVLDKHKVLPWKYSVYHALDTLIDLWKPERYFNPRLRHICSLTTGVYKPDFYYIFDKDEVKVLNKRNMGVPGFDRMY